MMIMEIFALLFVAAAANYITGLWDKNSETEKKAARKLMRKGIYGHFENGEFVFDSMRR